MTSSSPVAPRRRPRLLFAAGVAASMLLAACGGGDEGGDGGGGSGETAAGGAQREPDVRHGWHRRRLLPLRGGIANVISAELPGVVVTVQETNASVDNMQLLESDQAQLALALGDVVSDAVNGENTFTAPIDVCSLGNLYNNYVHFFTTADTGIKTIEDLRGKRVSPGAVGSASEVTADRIMQAAGSTRRPTSSASSWGAETVAAIQDGTVDAGAWSGGLPTGAIVDLASTDELVLIPTGEYAADLSKEYGDYYFEGEIPAETYEGQDEASPQVVSPNILVVRSDMDESSRRTSPG